MSKKIIIIGAGLSGLSAAPVLAKQGFDVTVIEKQSVPGGVARNFKTKGYTFDMGPTWYLMPEVYEDYFKSFGKDISDYYQLEHLTPSYKIYFEDQENCVIHPDLQKNIELFDRFEKNGGQKLLKFLKNASMKYNIAVNEFIYQDFRQIFQLMGPRTIFQGLKLNILGKLDSYTGKYFKNHRLKKILTFNSVFLGSSPYKTPALYSLMAHADFVQGVFFPKGGIYQLVAALYELGKEMGVNYQFNTSASKIVIDQKKIQGVESSAGFIPSDLVLSSADYHHTESELLEPRYRNYKIKSWDKRVMGPSTFIIFLGLKKKLPHMVHHNFYFTNDWKQHFSTIFDKPSWPNNPSYYVGVPSRTDPSLAPKDGESLFILVPVAPGLEDSEEVRQSFGNKILEHFEKINNDNLSDYIEVKKIVSHSNYINEGNMYKGASLGLSHTLFQTAFLRPSHWNKKINTLYYAGHHTQPGIGMPMQIIGGKMVAEHIIKEHREDE